MPVIIHVPERHISAVAQELHECKYFGFNRDRIVLLAQPSNPGYFFDEEDESFKKVNPHPWVGCPCSSCTLPGVFLSLLSARGLFCFHSSPGAVRGHAEQAHGGRPVGNSWGLHSGKRKNKLSTCFLLPSLQAPTSLKRPNGSGYSMKQLMWNYEATRLKEDGTREVMRKSVMNWLKDLGVSWVHSFQVDDLQRLCMDGALDMGALALTLKMHKTHEWQMSVQCAETPDLNVARAHGGILLSTDDSTREEVDFNMLSASVQAALTKHAPSSLGTKKARSAHAHQVKSGDLQSPKWSVILEQLQRKNGGHVVTTANRYFFNINTLDSKPTTAPHSPSQSTVAASHRPFLCCPPLLFALRQLRSSAVNACEASPSHSRRSLSHLCPHTTAEILMRKETFHTSLHLEGCYVYPQLHMSDITTAPDSRCVALVPKKPLMDATLAAPVEWCENAVQIMKDQDHLMLIRKVPTSAPPACACVRLSIFAWKNPHFRTSPTRRIAVNCWLFLSPRDACLAGHSLHRLLVSMRCHSPDTPPALSST